MVREYNWQLKVRSYEADAWGFVPAGALLRYLEQTAVAAAADAGYGDDFHRASNTAWVVRRLTLRVYDPPRQEAVLDLSTWISQIAKVRCVREYRVRDVSTGATICTAFTEWVHVRRDTQKPLAVPPNMAVDFAAPGHPLQAYDPPLISADPAQPRESRVERVAEWHEADSLGHINNAVYADWLDDALYSSLEGMGYDLFALREQRRYPRVEHYSLSYKRSALPGDRLSISTSIQPAGPDYCLVRQAIYHADGTELLVAESVRSMGRESQDA